MNKKEIGKQKEQQAVEFLQNKGYRILYQNYRTKIGEIDIVAKDNNTIVFIEVRSREYDTLGRPEESVNKRKQSKIAKVASLFLATYPDSYESVRFDVVAILKDKIVHIENAFWIDSVV